MPFMKVIKQVKGIKKKKGEIVLVEEEEVRDGILRDMDGIDNPTDALAPLTEEEAARCLKVEEIPI